MRYAATFVCVMAVICLGALSSHADAYVTSAVAAAAEARPGAPPPRLAENLPAAGAKSSSSQQDDGWLTSAEYQQLFDRMVSQQRYPRVVEARLFGDELRFKAEFVPFPRADFGFYSSHAMTPDEFARQDRINRARGYRLLHRQALKTKDTEFIQATWVPSWFQN
jgi:hypothetical protein